MVVCGGLPASSLVSLPTVPNSGGDLWWFAVMCGGFGGLWWFAVICGGLSFSHVYQIGPNFDESFCKNGCRCQPLNPHISGTSDPPPIAVEKLLDPATQQNFVLKLHNRFSLLSESDDSASSIENLWKEGRNALKETSHTVLGPRRRKKHWSVDQRRDPRHH